MNNTVIVPMRSGSQGLKDKNIKDFSGLPLYFWALKKLCHLMNMGKVTKIIVSSDNDWYLDKVKLNFPLMKEDFLLLSKRPEELATSFTTTEEVCLHELNKHNINDGILSIVEVTSPLIPVESLSSMMSVVDNSAVDSSFLVYADIGQFWKCNKNNEYRWEKLYIDRKMRQEETEILYREVGAWSIKINKFKECGVRIIDNSCIPIIIEKEFGLSINNEDDFYYAEYLVKQNAPQIFKNIGLYK